MAKFFTKIFESWAANESLFQARLIYFGDPWNLTHLNGSLRSYGYGRTTLMTKAWVLLLTYIPGKEALIVEPKFAALDKALASH